MTSLTSETEPVQIQERPIQVIEDRSLPAAQVIRSPSDPDQRPGLFIP